MSNYIKCDWCGEYKKECEYKIKLYKNTWLGLDEKYEKDLCKDCLIDFTKSFKE